MKSPKAEKVKSSKIFDYQKGKDDFLIERGKG
jgi:hypothetical protein